MPYPDIHEDTAAGKLTDNRFMKMSQRYDGEQQQLTKDIEELRRQCDKEDDRAFCWLAGPGKRNGAAKAAPSGQTAP